MTEGEEVGFVIVTDDGSDVTVKRMPNYSSSYHTANVSSKAINKSSNILDENPSFNSIQGNLPHMPVYDVLVNVPGLPSRIIPSLIKKP